MARIFFFVFILVYLSGCFQKKTLFQKIESKESGITFSNTITENDSINPIDLEFLYNGCGVAVGDFNKDNLPDLYFTASTSPNKLYLNLGNFKFRDITNDSRVTGEGMWSSSATIVDINYDGLDDIYVCTSIKNDPSKRRNLLYINEGIAKGKDYPVFRESAKEYGLADTSLSVVSSFTDFDNDGDLDMFLVTTKFAKRKSISFTEARDTTRMDVDKIFINAWDSGLNHPVFKDVSKQAGINEHGYGLGLATADINKDGWKDIYVTNDFFGSDNLYINNKNGTFTNKIGAYIKHTSENAMGVDINDINNDGLPDILSVDMNPEDSYRKKKNMNSGNYYIFQSMISEKIALQYVRNTLQLNMGKTMLSNDSIGEPVFGDISFYTNTAETDWSWNPCIADFNNDGKKDIIITNGYPRDVTDHDFVAFRTVSSTIASKSDLIAEMPVIKIPNYAFENTGDLSFNNSTTEWGLDQPSFSNGAVAVDLDNDGDLDYVVNNIDEEAFVYKNTLNDNAATKRNYLTIDFKGTNINHNGIGAIVELFTKNGMQFYENEPCRGYLSCVQPKACFGLDSLSVIDSILVRWPNHKKEILRNIKANQFITVNIADANTEDNWNEPIVNTNNLFTDITNRTDLNYTHKEDDYIDFDKERLIPHKLSQYGPGLATADVNGDGLDDIYIGSAAGKTGSLFLQQANGKFSEKKIENQPGRSENLGILFFDADGDGDEDLLCAGGSNEYPANSNEYSDKIYLNDGKGSFVENLNALPNNLTSKSCVRAADYDNDGDLDLFIGGRCLPGKYPTPVSSFIYRNESKAGEIKFTDVTKSICSSLMNIGMVCDALWTDFDNDGSVDLLIAGEWMPLTFYKNKKGIFENATSGTGIANQKGWWNSIAAGDFDNDGDIDYVVGNLGKNSFFRASDQYPVRVYAKDFDNNGNIDPIVTMYMKNKDGKLQEFPALNRDDIVSQIPSLKKKFLTYKSFAEADISHIFSPEELKAALILEANNFSSSYLQNNGNGKFEIRPLPSMAQLAPVNGMVVDDFNEDGNLDIALCANDYGNEVTAGRYDAMNGLVLLGDGAGNFKPQTILQSGFFVPGDAKALVKLRGANNEYLLAASQNNGPIKLFKKKHNYSNIFKPALKFPYAVIKLKNGKHRRVEFYKGSGFLSQSVQFCETNSAIKKIMLFNRNGSEINK